MIFDADSTKVEQAYDRMTVGNRELGRATVRAMNEGAAAIKAVTNALVQNNVVVKELQRENEDLRLQMRLMKSEAGGFSDAMRDCKSVFQMLQGAVIGSSIVGFIKKIIDAQIEWNKEIAKTQTEYDDVARRLQVQALMGDKEFQPVLQQEIIPLARQYKKFSIEDITGLYQALSSQGVEQKNLKDVAGQVIEGGLAIPGMKGSELADFGIAMTRQLVEKGMAPGAINKFAMGTEVVPAANIAGALRIKSGGEFLGMQEKLGGLAETFGVKQDDLTALVAALTPHIGRETAEKGMRMLLSNLIGDKGYNVMGEAMGDAFREQIANHDIFGAFSALRSGLGQLPAAQREQVLSKLFANRGGQNVLGRAILMHLDEAGQFKADLHDATRLQTAVGIATTGPAANEQAIKTEAEAFKLSASGQRLARNKQLMDLFEVEAHRQGVTAYSIQVQRQLMEMGSAAGRDYAAEWGETPLTFMGVKQEDAPIKRAVAATYAQITGQRQASQMPWLPGLLPTAVTAPAGAFEPSAEDKEIDNLKAQLLQAQQQVVDFEKQMHNPRIPLNQQQNLAGFKGFEDEKQHLHELKEIKAHLAELIEVAKGKKEQRQKAKNGLNL